MLPKVEREIPPMHMGRARSAVGLVIAAVVIGLLTAASPADEPSPTGPPVIEFRGLTPGGTTEKELLADEQWGTPTARTAVAGNTTLLHYDISQFKMLVAVNSGLVRSIDVVIPQGAAIAQAEKNFDLKDPRPKAPLPPIALIGEPVSNELEARQYDSGRFVSRDPIGYKGSPRNLYDYARGNALVRVDPSGLKCPPPTATLYGCFCGPSRHASCTKGPPGAKTVVPGKDPPIDPLDAACEIHDCCLADPYSWCLEYIYKTKTCNATFCAAIALIDCGKLYPGQEDKQKPCLEMIKNANFAFCAPPALPKPKPKPKPGGPPPSFFP